MVALLSVIVATKATLFTAVLLQPFAVGVLINEDYAHKLAVERKRGHFCACLCILLKVLDTCLHGGSGRHDGPAAAPKQLLVRPAALSAVRAAGVGGRHAAESMLQGLLTRLCRSQDYRMLFVSHAGSDGASSTSTSW